MKEMLVWLTNLAVWHYMLIENSGNKKIKIIGHKFIHGMNDQKIFTSDMFLEHTKFIIEMELRNI